MIRCGWANFDPLCMEYHDKEWGVPVHDDQKFFEMLLLEGAQAGLSWITILRKRENYRKAFDKFDAKKIARYDKKKIRRLLANEGIVRNQLKVAAAVQNANAFLRVQEEFGTFNDYVWRFVDGKPVRNTRKTLEEVPPSTRESQALSKDLQSRGFNFVGPTICYAFMQATGMVNDHIVSCFRHNVRKSERR